MRISDWSSDVCSSDLGIVVAPVAHQRERADPSRALVAGIVGGRRQWQEGRPVPDHAGGDGLLMAAQFGRLALAAAPLQMGIQRREALEAGDRRSEEHTSELQSLMRILYAVFCLKKKKTKIVI